MGKQQDYAALVQKRKACRICEASLGLKNQSVISNGEFDKEVAIGAWSLWQGSLDAKILVVGQDWGDQAYFERDHGVSGINDNVTDMNLIELFKSIGIHVEHPKKKTQNQLLFFTNTILCLKNGGLAAKITTNCYRTCANLFLKSLINIIQPQIIITLGKNAYQSVAKLYGQKTKPFKVLLDNIKQNHKPLVMPTCAELPTVILLPAPHCGQYSTNTFMNIEDQKKVWNSLKEYL